MAKTKNDTLEIQSNKKPHSPALCFLFAFCIIWFTGILVLMIYEFFFNPEEVYEWWIYIPVAIWILISLTVIFTLTWVLFSKNSKYKSITFTPSEWRIDTHRGKTITLPTSSIKTIKIKLVKNWSAYLIITKKRIRLRIPQPKRKYRLMISIRCDSRIFPCLLESFVPMSIIKHVPLKESEVLVGYAIKIFRFFEEPANLHLRDKVEFVGDIASLIS